LDPVEQRTVTMHVGTTATGTGTGTTAAAEDGAGGGGGEEEWSAAGGDQGGAGGRSLASHALASLGISDEDSVHSQRSFATLPPPSALLPADAEDPDAAGADEGDDEGHDPHLHTMSPASLFPAAASAVAAAVAAEPSLQRRQAESWLRAINRAQAAIEHGALGKVPLR
jgi:hypothetical protein